MRLKTVWKMVVASFFLVTSCAGTTWQEDVKVKPNWQVTEQATFLNLHTERKLSVNNCGFIPSAAAEELSKTIPTFSPDKRGRMKS